MSQPTNLPTFGAGSAEALMKSGQIWSAGIKTMSADMTASAKHRIDDTVANWSALSAVTSFGEAKEIQANFVRSFLEKAVADAKQAAEAYKKLMEKSLEPIKAEMMVAARHLKT